MTPSLTRQRSDVSVAVCYISDKSATLLCMSTFSVSNFLQHTVRTWFVSVQALCSLCAFYYSCCAVTTSPCPVDEWREREVRDTFAWREKELQFTGWPEVPARLYDGSIEDEYIVIVTAVTLKGLWNFHFCLMLKWLVWIIFIDTKARGLILINRNLVGLHEKHAVGTWNFENHLNICLQTANIRQMFA